MLIITKSELRYLHDVLTQAEEGDTTELEEGLRMLEGYIESDREDFNVVERVPVSDTAIGVL